MADDVDADARAPHGPLLMRSSTRDERNLVVATTVALVVVVLALEVALDDLQPGTSRRRVRSSFSPASLRS